MIVNNDEALSNLMYMNLVQFTWGTQTTCASRVLNFIDLEGQQ